MAMRLSTEVSHDQGRWPAARRIARAARHHTLEDLLRLLPFRMKTDPLLQVKDISQRRLHHSRRV